MIKNYFYKPIFVFLLGVSSPFFKNNFLARLFAKFSGNGWGIELCIVLLVPLQRIFKNCKIAGTRNLITTLDCKP